MYYTPHPFISNLLKGFRLFEIFTSRGRNSVDPDQLASQKPADPDLHCFQNRIYPGPAWKGLMEMAIKSTVKPV